MCDSPCVAEASRYCYAFVEGTKSATAHVTHAAPGKASFDSLGKRHLGLDNCRGRPAKAKRTSMTSRPQRSGGTGNLQILSQILRTLPRGSIGQKLKQFSREVFCILEKESMTRVGIKNQLCLWCIACNRKAMFGRDHDVRDSVSHQHRHAEVGKMRPCRAIALPP